MTDDALLGPVPRYAVTTVIGASGLEAARLTAAIVPQYYVSLGDSLAQGCNPTPRAPSVPTNQGYADDL